MSLIILEEGSNNEEQDEYDRVSLKAWQPECEWMRERGVYADIAFLVGLKRGDVYMNLCAGLCPLEEELLRSRPEAHVISVETNLRTMDAAARRLIERGIPVHRVTTRAEDDVFCRGPGGIADVYQRSWQSLSGEVLALQADIHDHSRVRNLLGTQQPSVTTLTFAGASLKEVYKKYDIGIAGSQGMQNTIDDVIRAAYALTTAITPPGGRLVRAERAARGQRESPASVLNCAAREYRAKVGRYWEVGVPQYVQELTGAPCAHELQARLAGITRFAYGIVLQRNDRPCTLPEAQTFMASAEMDGL